MNREQLVSPIPFVRNASLGMFAAAAILGWVLVEVGFRWGVGPVLADPLRSALGADMIVMAIGFTLAAGGIAWGGRRVGISSSEWDYTVSRRSVAAGIVAGVVGFLFVYFVSLLVLLLNGGPASSATATGGIKEPLWAIGALLLVNGVLVPILEELAWRGVIQTALMESYGTIVGGVITAAAFVLKHVIVDWGEPVTRLVSLIVLALLLCGLRARFGTTSSTICHIGVNSLATVIIIVTIA